VNNILIFLSLTLPVSILGALFILICPGVVVGISVDLDASDSTDQGTKVLDPCCRADGMHLRIRRS
jgi:hypothetical protein